jgi:hypothetical protein
LRASLIVYILIETGEQKKKCKQLLHFLFVSSADIIAACLKNDPPVFAGGEGLPL